MSVGIAPADTEVPHRWPHIRRFLRVDSAGRIDDDLIGFERVADTLPSAEGAAAWEEWAVYFEWRLEQRAAELAGDRVKRHLVEKWTDGMAYCCRRSAAWARGEDPGEWVPLWERRPDLDATGRAIVAEIAAELDAGNDQEGSMPAVRAA